MTIKFHSHPEPGGHYADCSKPDIKRQTLHDLTYIQNLKKSNSEAESRIVVSRGQGQGRWGDVGKGY